MRVWPGFRGSSGTSLFKPNLSTPIPDQLWVATKEVKGSVNPEIVKNTARCNFLIITVMSIKVYISRMEISHRIRFDVIFYQKC